MHCTSARKVGDDTSAAIVLTVRGIVSFRSTQTVLADVQCTSPLVRLSLIHIFIFQTEEEYNTEYAAGVVCDQYPRAQTASDPKRVKENAKITLLSLIHI